MSSLAFPAGVNFCAYLENIVFKQASLANYDLKNVITPNRIHGVWRLMTGYQWKYIGAAFGIGIAAVSKTASYFLLRYFIDNYFGSSVVKYSVWLIGAGFIVLAAIQGGSTFWSGKLTAQTSEGTTRRLRNYLFDHIQRLSFSYHNQTDTGELIQRSTSDVDAMRRFYADQAISFGRIILLFLVNFLALMTINVRLSLISIVVVPIIILVSMFFFKRVSDAYKAFQEQEAVLSTTLQENLTGVRVVKAFARQQYEISKFERDNWENFLRGKKLTTMHSLFWPISDTLCGFQMLAGYLVAAIMAINGTITVGDFLAYAGILVWIIFPMRNLGRLIVQMSTGLVSFDRVVHIIKQEREPLDEGDYHPQEGIKGAFRFDHVCFEYEPPNTVLEDISFECQPGQVIALLGSTGSGKTTLVNLIPRFFDYTSGEILLDGVDLKRYPRRYLRQQIGIVEQEPFLFSRSIRENITYGVGRDIPQEEIEAAAKAAAIHDVIIDVLGGYQTIVGERGTTLSGGQKQRVAIARALLKNPRILILDDSTSSVDTETEAEIREALQHLMKERTTFIIAHRIQSIMNADLILVMENGRITQRGTHEDLVTQEGIYRKIFDMQTRIEFELEEEIAGVDRIL
jgi:ATP-binding cassette subfamily B protein